MNTKALLWKVANSQDDHFNAYSQRGESIYLSIEKLPFESRSLMYKMLELNPQKRCNIPDILQENWMKDGIEACTAQCKTSASDSRFIHKHYGPH
jgi:hypothetical protein